MATANFRNMANFPLIVASDTYIKVCPECYCSNEEDAEKCSECGCDITDTERHFDDIAAQEIVKEMEKVADSLNSEQSFFSVSVESGYYSGVQFYVDEEYYNLEDFTNEDARNEFDMCRSAMLRKYATAANKISKGLYKAKDELDMEELVCTARFSNGEAWYHKVDTRKPLPLKVAVKAALAS